MNNNLLPSVPLPKSTVEIEGQTINIKSLSRSQALKLTTQFKDNFDGAELFILACGVGCTEEEAAVWRDNTDPIHAGKLIDAIIDLTGLVDDPKS